MRLRFKTVTAGKVLATMETNPAGYFSYLLRLWRETEHASPRWHAALESAQTREQHYFATLEELVKFLYRQTLGAADVDTPSADLSDDGSAYPSAASAASLRHE